MQSNITLRNIFIYCVIAISYLLLGIAGTTLAIPPGYSSVIFPAAGLGFVVALRCGVRFLPAVWLGSFSLNIWIAFQTTSISPTTIVIAALLGLGASLQAWAASYLVQQIAKINWKELTTSKDIIVFLALSGPVASLVSATWGNFTLFMFNVISSDALFLNWANWWLGDSTGVITLAPVLLALLLSKESAWVNRKIQIVVPTTIAVVVTLFFFFYMADKENRDIDIKLSELGANILDNLSSDLLIYQEAIATLETLKQTRPDISFEEFKEFSYPFLDRHPNLQAVSINAYVTAQDKADFEATLSQQLDKPNLKIKELNPSGKMIPALDRNWYVPVSYIVPVKGNEQAIAFDIASNPVRLEAINYAIKSNKHAVTAPIRLVQESGSSTGILMINPINNAHTGLLEAFAVAVIRIENIMHTSLADKVAQGLNISIKDTDPSLADGTLYRSSKNNELTTDYFTWEKQLDIAQRHWQISITPTVQFVHQFTSYLPWQVLLVSLWLVSLLQILLLIITGQHYRDANRINEQNKAHALLMEQKIVAEQANRTKSEFLSNISHELRTPMHGILSFANLGSTKAGTATREKLQQYFANIHISGERLLTLLNDLLDLSKLEAGKMVVTFSPENLSDVFDACYREQEAHIHQQGLTLEVSKSTFPTVAEFDAARIAQVITNLLSNAIKFSPEGGIIMVTIEFRNDGLLFSLRDHGLGIPQSELDTIFDAFIQSSQTTTGAGGTGLGLAICKQIIDMHHGKIWAENNPDGGATFRFKLPLVQPQKAATGNSVLDTDFDLPDSLE